MRGWLPTALVFCVACGGSEPPPPPTAALAAGVPHGDHAPHHGGVVMMNGDLHYEVVLDPRGRYRLYFTDAARSDLPAATAHIASITVLRAGSEPEGIALRIDESGESWVGEGRSVADPQTTTVRVSYAIRGEEPYWIDLPFDAKAASTDAHR